MLRAILIIVAILIVLSLFKIRVLDIVNNQFVRENFSYVWNWLKQMWSSYLAKPISYVWNEVFVKLLWWPFEEAMERIKAGRQPELFENAPKAP